MPPPPDLTLCRRDETLSLCGFEDEEKGESEKLPEVPPQLITHLEPAKPAQDEPIQLEKQAEEVK